MVGQTLRRIHNRILKPPTLGLDDLAYNEHFCLTLARALGMPAAASHVQRFGDEIAIVVERYDRELLHGRLVRVHQEDLCQAFGISPTKKYETDGGPDTARIYELLGESSSSPDEDRQRFLDAIALNWLIAATDAHAKNYSVLHAVGPQLRLAPLYDVITILPYPQLDYDRSMLAMSIGGERQISRIDASHWRRMAKQLGVDPAYCISRVRAMATRIPEAVDALNAATHADDYMRTLARRLGEAVSEHAARCARRLA